MTSHPNFRVQLAAHYSLTEIDGKLVLFSKNTGDFFGLNESALVLLKHLSDHTFEDAVKFGISEFQVAESELRQDILDLVQELESHKILKRVPL